VALTYETTSNGDSNVPLAAHLRRLTTALATAAIPAAAVHAGSLRAAAQSLAEIDRALATVDANDAVRQTRAVQQQINATVTQIQNISTSACPKHASVFIECGEGTFSGDLAFAYGGNLGGAELHFTSGMSVGSLLSYFQDVGPFVGITAAVCPTNPSRVELRSIGAGADQFVSVVQLGATPRLYAHSVGGAAFSALADWGCAPAPTQCAERGAVYLSTGEYYFVYPGSLTLEFAGNFGARTFTFASGSTVQNILAVLNEFGAAAGFWARPSEANPNRLEILSSALGSGAFVSVSQISGPMPIVFDSSTGGQGMFEFKDFGRNDVEGDANCDWHVDSSDLAIVVNGWGACPKPPSSCPGDVDQNGVVDMDDLVLVITNWGISG
jgi:hypothetical protein